MSSRGKAAPERHVGHRAGWLRAAVLGANDGLVSTSSLMVGVATASGSQPTAVVTAGLAGLAAGAMAMAAGEWVSVSSQADIEHADLALERRELLSDPAGEREELAAIYRARGLSPALAEQVAAELSDRDLDDLVEVHARDELGFHDAHLARPGQAALASAISFSIGGLVPFVGLLGPAEGSARIAEIVLVTLLGLAGAGILGAAASGTRWPRPTLRVVLGGSAAMAVTALVGHLAGVAGI
ncbi:MAG TPA: VIT1/CCC1 transporter family protein [Coriobacteriia bacterium]